MPKYRVTWEVNVEAENPTAAARKAYAIMQDPSALPPFFEVADLKTNKGWDIDMELVMKRDTR